MTSIIVKITKEPAGWFVVAHDSIGPFFSRERAANLAEGMVSALRASGQDVQLVAADEAAQGATPLHLRRV
jgi:hypothetical protein